MIVTTTVRQSAVALAAIACCWPVSAAEQSFEEIIVTADYRERTLQELPQSISVLQTATIEEAAVQHFEELLSLIPNMNWSGDGHRAKYFQIRGVGELAQYQGAPNPSIGFIVDDIDFSGIGAIATLNDIQRIEVLRGPQGTRYGANALGGLVFVQSTEPDGEFGGNISANVGGDYAWGLGGAVGGGLGDSGGFRLSAHHYEANGFRDNPYLDREDTNGRDETSVRGKVRWQAGENWNFTLTAMYVDVNDGYDAFAIDNSLTVLSDNPGMDAQESVGASFRIDWSGARTFDLTSITSYANSEIDFSFDADWGNEDAWAPVTYDFVTLNDRSRTTVSQEIRLTSTEDGELFNGSTRWLVGVYFNRMDEDLATENLGDYFDPGSGFGFVLDDPLDSEFQAENSALFGQLDFGIGQSGRLTFGMRFEQRSTDYTDSDGLDLGPTESMVGGELSYQHEFADELSGFVTLARGYKAGGFNLGQVPDEFREFDQETLWNIEVGIKSTLADGRLMLNSSVFYSQRQDQQVETSFQITPGDPSSFIFYTDNAAEGETIGLEADVRWLPVDTLELYASVGFLRAKFSEYDNPLLDLTDRDQAHAPRYTVAIGGSYVHSSGFFSRADFSAKDDFYFDVSHDQKSRSYSVANLRLGYEWDDWMVQVYARNVFDERYAVRGFYFGNEPPNFPDALYVRQGDPRQIGITAEWRF